MKLETRMYKITGRKQKKRIAKFRNLKVGIWGWLKMYFNLK